MSISAPHDSPDGCQHCGEPRRERQCCACGLVGLIIDCGHMAQPRPIAAGKVDGSDGQHDYCSDCAEEV